MKKLITILTIMLLISSCGRDAINYTNGCIITDIEQYDNRCLYYTTTTKWFNHPYRNKKNYFVDSCGKYNIGDTIKLYKL